MTWRTFKRKGEVEATEYVPGQKMDGVSISEEDVKAGSPKAGDMIARNPVNYNDKWLINKAYFEKNYTGG